MTKRNGQRAAKQDGGREQTPDLAKSQRIETVKRVAKTSKPVFSKSVGSIAPVAAVAPIAPIALPRTQVEDSVEADLSRMISELNEVRMRLDAIVRKLATSALDIDGSRETVDDVERLRMRLLGKLDRIREQLVTRLSEERVAAKDR